jgi:2-succinyl-5-enolpyruvyl-6-hydroxy-3-cyclohexene-1-carboxylate synthase
MTAEMGIRQALSVALRESFMDASVIPLLMEALPEGANLVVGNSLPVRHMDQFALPTAKEVRVYGNRGASGIDGVTSTALGIAAAEPSRPTALLIGDVSFFHDMNGLLAIRQQGLTNVTIVLLNNDGGSIFRRLPVSRLEPSFTPLFLTPHGLDFRHAAQLYGLVHTLAGGGQHVSTALAAALSDQANAHLIEIPTDGAQDEARRKEIVSGIGDQGPGTGER